MNSAPKESILVRLKRAFVLAVASLGLCLIVFNSMNGRLLRGILQAHTLDGQIIEVNHLQEIVRGLEGQVEASQSETLQRNESQGAVADPALEQLLKGQFEKLRARTQEVHSQSRTIVDWNYSELTGTINDLEKAALRARLASAEESRARILEVRHFQSEVIEHLSKWALAMRSRISETFVTLNSERWYPLLYSLLVTLVLSAGLIIVLSRVFRRIKSFVNQQQQGTAKLSHGDLDWRLPTEPSDEFGLINDHFNQMAEQLTRTQVNLVRSNQDLKDFAHTIGHDFRTPLTHIKAFAKRLHESKDGIDRQRNLHELLGSVDDLFSLMDDLLKMASIGRTDLPLEEISLSEGVESTLQQIRDVFPHAQISSSLKNSVFANRTLLRTLVQNLLENAIKYIPSGRIPSVDVTSLDQGDFIEIQICDNGDGIPVGQEDRIFALFRRLHQNEQVKGTGAGLAICRKIVEHFGGRIWVEKNSKGGATFCFTLRKNSTTAISTSQFATESAVATDQRI